MTSLEDVMDVAAQRKAHIEALQAQLTRAYLALGSVADANGKKAARFTKTELVRVAERLSVDVNNQPAGGLVIKVSPKKE